METLCIITKTTPATAERRPPLLFPFPPAPKIHAQDARTIFAFNFVYFSALGVFATCGILNNPSDRERPKSDYPGDDGNDDDEDDDIRTRVDGLQQSRVACRRVAVVAAADAAIHAGARSD